MNPRRLLVPAGLAPFLLATATSACARGPQGPPSPVDLDWLRSECEGGALVHHADGRLYLTELETGESEFLANGNQPEFSPDGARVAWISGNRAMGRLRSGDPSVYVIARGVEPSGGVHWLGDDAVALVLRRQGTPAWYRVGLDGGEEAIPELTALGTGGYECDVKLCDDGVWSYVADQGWKTSDGHWGKVPGTCSVSLSPDGATVTSLHNPHKDCDLTAIRPRGITARIVWPYAGGYDNHRFASSDPRFLVTVDEHTETMVVMTVDGERCTRVGTLGHANGGMYGDWTSRRPSRTDWIPTEEEPPTVDEDWPTQQEDTVFVWDTALSSNTLASRPAAEALCRLELRDAARVGARSDLLLDGGRAEAESGVVAAALVDLEASGEGGLELFVTCDRAETEGAGTILDLAGRLELVQDGTSLALLVEAPGAPRLGLGEVRAGEGTHVALAWSPTELVAYRDGEEQAVTELARPLSWKDASPALVLGARPCGERDWRGRVEGVALTRRPPDRDAVRAAFELRSRRVAHRAVPERRTVRGVLVAKRPLPRPDLYPDTLVAYDYRLPDGLATVVHWGILDGRIQTAIRDRRVEGEYRLWLEPWSAHAELQRFKLVGSEEVVGRPWFDATPPALDARLR